MATNNNIAQGQVLIGQPLRSNLNSVNHLLCKMPVTVNQKMPWPQENHKLRVFICFPNSSFSVFLNVLSRCIRKKASEMGEEQSPPTQRATCHLELPRSEGRTWQVSWPGRKQHRYTCSEILRSWTDGVSSCMEDRSTWWGRRICSSTRWWHSIIVFIAMTDLAVQPRNNWLLGCHRSLSDDGEPNRVVFPSWQRKNLIKTISDLQMSEVNKTITTAFLTAVTT